MKKYITEFIGTLFLVLAVGLSEGNPLAIGATLMVMIYAGGHISGGHYNPAVTLAVFVRKRIALNEALIFIGCQLAGALIAALLVSIFVTFPAVEQSLNITKALVAELLGTFALAYVVLNVATAKSTSGNSFYGLAIGFTVFAMAACFGRFSGGAFNPAVAVGAIVMDLFKAGNIWIYIVGCFGGGILAGLVFNMNNPEDK